MGRRRAGVEPWTAWALAALAALGGILAACSTAPWNPLDQVSYSGHASAEFAVDGKTYHQDWDFAIRRVGGLDYYDPAGRSERWQIAPNDVVVKLPDGSAVWIDGDAGTPSPPTLIGFAQGGAAGSPLDGAATLAPGRTVTVGVPAMWLDSLSRPTMIKLAMTPCPADFPIAGCSVAVRYSLAGAAVAAARPGMFRHYVFNRRTAAQAFGVSADDFAGGRYYRCPGRAWSTARVAPRLLATTVLQPVALTWAESLDLEAHCGIAESPAWPDAGPKAANGNELGLGYAGHGVWEVPAEPRHAEIFYRMEPALGSVGGRPALRTLRGEFGSIDAPAEWPEGFAAVISATGEIIVVSVDTL